jgi:hypothetical protein
MPANLDEGMDALRYKVLEHYGLGNEDEDVAILRRTLWDQEPPEATFFEPLFRNYQRWFEKRIQPQFARAGVSVHRSHFPGDLCVEVNLSGHVPLGIVGLNSTWIQYKEGDFEGKLELPTQQFQAALVAGEDNSPLQDRLRQGCRVELTGRYSQRVLKTTSRSIRSGLMSGYHTRSIMS